MPGARRRPKTGVFSEAGAGWFYRLGTGAKAGPFDSWAAAATAYEKACHARLMASRSRGNPRRTRI
jgi:hypothetical protein